MWKGNKLCGSHAGCTENESRPFSSWELQFWTNRTQYGTLVLVFSRTAPSEVITAVTRGNWSAGGSNSVFNSSFVIFWGVQMFACILLTERGEGFHKQEWQGCYFPSAFSLRQPNFTDFCIIGRRLRKFKIDTYINAGVHKFRSPGAMNFVCWHLISVCRQYGTCSMSPFWRTKFWGGSSVLITYVHPCIVSSSPSSGYVPTSRCSFLLSFFILSVSSFLLDIFTFSNTVYNQWAR